MTILELMIVVGIIGLVLAVIATLSIGNWRAFLIGRTLTDVHGGLRLAMDLMVRDIREAEAIYTNPLLGYETDGDTLVLKMPSFHQYEFIIYNGNPPSLERIVMDGDGSEVEVRCRLLSELSFDPNEEKEKVGIKLVLRKESLGAYYSESVLRSSARLRNKR